jgi:chemotaxis protein histidine kinase CheA
MERSLQERLYEPLLHLVRNAVSHGVEDAPVRTSGGKPSSGTVTLEARGGLSSLVVLVSDDGRGLDADAIRRRGVELQLLDPVEPVSEPELFRLIFHPGFSTRRRTTEVSGRGVGMDVVARTLRSLRGRVDVDSVPGRGTTVRLTIPLHSVIEHTMIFRAAGQLFALPMRAIDAANADASRMGDLGGDDLPVVSVRELLRLGEDETPGAEKLLFVRRLLQGDASAARRSQARIALAVDEILGPEEVVVRPLPPVLKRHPLFAGATLAAGGQTVLIFESQRLLEIVSDRQAVPTNEFLERNDWR